MLHKKTKILFKNPDAFVSRISDILENKKEVLGDELLMVNGRILERDYVPIYENSIYRGHLWTYRDVTLRRKYRKSLEAQRQKYRNIIANMNLGLIEVDNNDKILMVNQSFTEMSGYSEQELIGKIGNKLFCVDNNNTIIETENLKRQVGESNSYEIKVKNKAGAHRHWLVSGAPNYNLNGEVVGSIGIHLDITDLKALEIQKENLLVQLEKSNDELQEYAHIVSHDLKSPLRSINALVSWLKEDNKEKLDDASMQNFTLIETTLEKMEQLISDVLEYSCVTTDESEKVAVNLDEVLLDLIKIMYKPEHVTIKILNNFQR
ncbi:sensor histidine kinase [Jejuia pallidilutea]|uniref:sensor histidine kinase n=1 Tax=Jejuia pallidilutea TaxID=504487 RepID=UPI0034E2CCC2